MLALLRWLPRDAAIWQGEPPSWSWELELAATQVELLHGCARLLMQLGGVKRSALPAAVKVPRPTDNGHRTDPGKHKTAEFLDYLARVTPRQGR